MRGDHPPNPRAEELVQEIDKNWRAMLQKRGSTDADGSPFSLAVGWRIRLVWIASGLTQEEFSEACAIEHNTLEPIISPRKPTKPSEATVKSVVRFINDRRRKQPRREDMQTVSSDKFRYWSCTGKDAVRTFLRWLWDDDIDPRQNTDLLPTIGVGPLIRKDAQRLKVLREVRTFLAASDMRSLFFVHQKGMAIGLTALARELCERSRTSEYAHKPICYLPLGRLPQTNRRASYAALVAFLKAFYLQEGLEEAQPTLSFRQLQADVAFIRSRMMRRPAILIFDGHRALSETLGNLEAAILDDPLVMLLRELVYPLVGPADETVSPSTFYKTRILVFSDGPPLFFKNLEPRARIFPLPPPKYVAKLLENHGRNHRDAVADICKRSRTLQSDAALDVIECLIELRHRRGLSDHSDLVSTLGSKGFGHAVEELLSELAHHSLALKVLYLAALPHDGVRLSTLSRILKDIQSLPKEWKQQNLLWQSPVEADLASIKKAIELLGRLVWTGPDERIAGLDDDTDAGFGWDFGGPSEPPIAIEFRTTELREAVLDRLARSRAAPVLHRLVAETALQQMTIIMRHGNWQDVLSARFYRRLFQALFHGLTSISDGPEFRFLGFEGIRHVIPTHNAVAYRRLYSVFYRMLVDSPPHWELSRVLGRDAVKADLVLLALKAGPPVKMKSRQESSGAAPAEIIAADAGHQQTAAGERADHQIRMDQQLNLARAYYQQGNLTGAETILQSATKSLAGNKVAPLPGESEESKYWLGIVKTSIDVAILKNAHSVHDMKTGEIESALGRVGFEAGWINQLDTQASAIRTAGTSQAIEEKIAKEDETIAKNAAGKSSTHLAAWSDLISRWAEILALQADAGGSPIDQAPLFFTAFMYFVVAEKYRRLSFQAAPMGRDYIVNGHSTRVFVRIILQLVKAIDGAAKKGDEIAANGLPSRQYLMLLARQHIDILTRYFSRYPTERPSILLLEAQFVRIGGAPERRQESLLVAQRLVAKAERMLWAAIDRPRVRFRLLLERIKIFRDRAYLEVGQAGLSPSELSVARDAAARLAEYASYDAVLLCTLARRTGVQFWVQLAEGAITSLLQFYERSRVARPKILEPFFPKPE